MLITGVACTALLAAMSDALRQSEASAGNTRATLLAQAVLDEIAAGQWSDPDDPEHWGVESDERSRDGRRTAFDDVDDYDGLTESPPRLRDGTSLDEWQRRYFPATAGRPYLRLTCHVRVRPIADRDGVRELAVTQVSPYRRVTVAVSSPHHAPVELSRVFTDFDAIRSDGRTATFGASSEVTGRSLLPQFDQSPGGIDGTAR